MDILLLPLVVIAWVSVPGVLIGWLAGFLNWHLYAAILWGIIILITYPRAKGKGKFKLDALTVFLAIIQAGAGGAIAYFVGAVTH
jgi:ABC-type Mn2+/Zn2+ transport system permease subunit